MKRMILGIFVAACVVCAGAGLLFAQDDFVLRYIKVETRSHPKLPIRIKSAEVEKLEHDSLLTVSMFNQTNRIVKDIRLQLRVFDCRGKFKSQKEWIRSADLFGGNNAVMDLVLTDDVRRDDRLSLRLLDAK